MLLRNCYYLFIHADIDSTSSFSLTRRRLALFKMLEYSRGKKKKQKTLVLWSWLFSETRPVRIVNKWKMHLVIKYIKCSNVKERKQKDLTFFLWAHECVLSLRPLYFVLLNWNTHFSDFYLLIFRNNILVSDVTPK